MEQPGATKNIFTVKKSLNSSKTSKFSYISKTNPQNKFNCARIFKNLKRDQICFFMC